MGLRYLELDDIICLNPMPKRLIPVPKLVLGADIWITGLNGSLPGLGRCGWWFIRGVRLWGARLLGVGALRSYRRIFDMHILGGQWDQRSPSSLFRALLSREGMICSLLFRS